MQAKRDARALVQNVDNDAVLRLSREVSDMLVGHAREEVLVALAICMGACVAEIARDDTTLTPQRLMRAAGELGLILQGPRPN
jgi:hypothetical protein